MPRGIPHNAASIEDDYGDLGFEERDWECTHCGGDGFCYDGSDPLGNCPDEIHNCHACHGTGKRKDQTIF